MPHYTVLVPQRNLFQAFKAQLPRLTEELQKLALPYEILCIDDYSRQSDRNQLIELCSQHPQLRLITLDRYVGLSRALSAGIAAARGEIVITIEPGQQYFAACIPHLIARLSGADFVQAKQKRKGMTHSISKISGIPRRILLGLDSRDPDCLLWAARREAIAGLDLSRGTARYISSLVTMRGYRTANLTVTCKRSEATYREPWTNPLDMLALAWHVHRYAVCDAKEQQATSRQAETASHCKENLFEQHTVVPFAVRSEQETSMRQFRKSA